MPEPGTQTGGRGRCSGRGHELTSEYCEKRPFQETALSRPTSGSQLVVPRGSGRASRPSGCRCSGSRRSSTRPADPRRAARRSCSPASRTPRRSAAARASFPTSGRARSAPSRGDSRRIAFASTAAGRFGFGVMSYEVCPCSVTATPSKPARSPASSSSMNQLIGVEHPPGSTSSAYGVETDGRNLRVLESGRHEPVRRLLEHAYFHRSALSRSRNGFGGRPVSSCTSFETVAS